MGFAPSLELRGGAWVSLYVLRLLCKLTHWRSGPSGSCKKKSSKASECVETEARHFAVPAPSKAAFSECACLQALSLINFYSGLEALTGVHTEEACSRLSAFAARDVPTSSTGRSGVEKAAFYLL